MAESSIRIAELEERAIEGVCLVCSNKTRETRKIHIRRENGGSIISFNICKDCLWRLSFSIRDAVDDFEGIG